ncbi:Retrovirus-related Pol polyprotein from transposon opus, partial [Mucuna pruriens]
MEFKSIIPNCKIMSPLMHPTSILSLDEIDKKVDQTSYRVYVFVLNFKLIQGNHILQLLNYMLKGYSDIDFARDIIERKSTSEGCHFIRANLVARHYSPPHNTSQLHNAAHNFYGSGTNSRTMTYLIVTSLFSVTIKGTLDLKFINTKNQLADIFIKPLSKDKLVHIRNLLGEDPQKNLKEFHSTMRLQGILEDYIKMKAFSFSLDEATKDWLYLQSVLFRIWGDMKRMTDDDGLKHDICHKRWSINGKDASRNKTADFEHGESRTITCVGVFMDDFTVYLESFDAYLENLSWVLTRCIETNLVLNFEKCHFMVTEGMVLGHLVSSRGIEVNKAKVDIITSLLNPASV